MRTAAGGTDGGAGGVGVCATGSGGLERMLGGGGGRTLGGTGVPAAAAAAARAARFGGGGGMLRLGGAVEGVGLTALVPDAGGDEGDAVGAGVGGLGAPETGSATG